MSRPSPAATVTRWCGAGPSRRWISALWGSATAEANDINEDGLIVGHVSSFRGFSTIDGRAVLWHDDAPVDLNDLLPVGSPWQLHSAEGVNERGEIVGFGRLHGELRSFLLTVPASALG